MADYDDTRKRNDELFVDTEVRSDEQPRDADFKPLKRQLKSRHLQMIAIGGKPSFFLSLVP